MIEGIGIDLIAIDKIKLAVEDFGDRFLKRVFSEDELLEINILNKEKIVFQKIAGHFAAKEAFLKSIGCGLFSIPLNKICIFNKITGAPYFKLDDSTNNLILLKYGKKINKVHLTISHDNGFAVAFVVMEK